MPAKEMVVCNIGVGRGHGPLLRGKDQTRIQILLIHLD